MTGGEGYVCRCAEVPLMPADHHWPNCPQAGDKTVMQGGLGPDGDGFRYIAAARVRQVGA